jgi:hypothetical protein
MNPVIILSNFVQLVEDSKETGQDHQRKSQMHMSNQVDQSWPQGFVKLG